MVILSTAALLVLVSSGCRHHHLGHLLSQRDLGLFDVPLPAYANCPGMKKTSSEFIVIDSLDQGWDASTNVELCWTLQSSLDFLESSPTKSTTSFLSILSPETL